MLKNNVQESTMSVKSVDGMYKKLMDFVYKTLLKLFGHVQKIYLINFGFQ